MSLAVVIFVGNAAESVEVVRSCWLKNERSKQYSKLIRNDTEPEDSWNCYEVRIVGKYGEYPYFKTLV